MDKNVYRAVASREDGYCGVCHQYGGDALELHHILRRKVVATKENCIMLCKDCHRSNNGVHGGSKEAHELDLDLKLQLQYKYFKQKLHEGEIRKLMGGRLYSKEERKCKVNHG